MLASVFRRRAIRAYASGLLSRLRREHGVNAPNDMYSADHVLETLHRHGFNVRCERYAVAMYCDEKSYEAERARRGWPENYGSLRKEIETVVLRELRRPHFAGPAVYIMVSGSGGSSGHHHHSSGHDGQC